jgi:hypothetical protein
MTDKPKIFIVGEILKENEHRLNQAAKKALIGLKAEIQLNLPYWIQLLGHWLDNTKPTDKIDPRLETNIEAARARFWERIQNPKTERAMPDMEWWFPNADEMDLPEDPEELMMTLVTEAQSSIEDHLN